MRRPTERFHPGVAQLKDAEAPDFIEGHRVTLLAFLDLAQDASLRLRGRLNLVTARHARPDEPRALGAAVIDVADQQDVAQAMGVREVPAIFVFVDGHVEDRLAGVVPESVLEEVIATRMGKRDEPEKDDD